MPQSSHPLLRVPVPWVFVLNYLLGIALHMLVPLPFSWTLPVRPDIVGGVLFVSGRHRRGFRLVGLPQGRHHSRARPGVDDVRVVGAVPVHEESDVCRPLARVPR